MIKIEIEIDAEKARRECEYTPESMMKCLDTNFAILIIEPLGTDSILFNLSINSSLSDTENLFLWISLGIFSQSD